MSRLSKPGEDPFTTRTPRVSAALKLHRRKERDETGRFLAEGPQAVREALAAGVVSELFATPERARDYPNATLVTEDAMAKLAETVAPQGIVAVCEQFDAPLGQAAKARLVAVLVDIRDPGNAGTILRTADAAGASAVIFAGESVDPYNGKAVRASAGSLFHVDIVRERDTDKVLQALSQRILATSGRGTHDLFDLDLSQPTAWVFGGEAHGLPGEVLERVETVRIPIYGAAESLNLSAAAAVCLYTSARAQRHS